jgi:hypothetical protein
MTHCPDYRSVKIRSRAARYDMNALPGATAPAALRSGRKSFLAGLVVRDQRSKIGH